ncbi:MAG TPA: DNA polymerase III subunit epsilon, partial [Pseudomonadaceae bacterium]|nr:DNA polymerase III subunit epsilon [Pseudomonadaceae bacterium]
YLMMTGGQSSLVLGYDQEAGVTTDDQGVKLDTARPALRVIVADAAELAAHAQTLQGIAKGSGNASLWEQMSLPVQE